MANLTIAIDDELLRAARIKAVAEGTSVNEVCRKAIEHYTRPEGDAAETRLATLRAIAKKVRPSPTGEPLWPGREVLYAEAMRERGLTKQPLPVPTRTTRRR